MTKGSQLLRDLLIALEKWDIRVIYFLGDADTATNFEFARQAAFLAQNLAPKIRINLPCLTLDGPKGVDDCRENHGEMFPEFFGGLIRNAIPVSEKLSSVALSLVLLERELAAIRTLNRETRELHFARIIKMLAAATRAEADASSKSRLRDLSAKILGLGKREIDKAVGENIRNNRLQQETSKPAFKAHGPNHPEITESLPPEIKLPEDNRYLSKFFEELGRLLHPREVFWRFDRCVAPKQDEKGRFSLGEVTSQEFRSLIERFCQPFRYRKINHGSTGEKVRRSLSSDDAGATLVSRNFLGQLRPIRSFNQVRLPAFYGRGQIQRLPLGYDEVHQVYTAPNASNYQENMSLETARAFWKDLVSEFCFIEADRDRSTSVVLAAGLTLFAAHLLPSLSIRPIFLASANSEGSGKSLLLKIPIVALLGYAPAGTVTRDEDEMRKLIGSAAVSGSPVLFLDNVRGHLASASLEALTTTPVTQFRLLGQNKLMEPEHGLTVFITANRATFSPDLRRRTLVVELFLSDVRPESRRINKPLDDGKLADLRPQILGAFWAFVREWARKMFPRPKTINQSFVGWSEVIGGIVECAGYPSPCANSLFTISGDRELVEMETLVNEMVEGNIYNFSDIVDLARHHRLFEWVIGDEGTLDPKARSKFGLLLTRFVDRIFPSGFRFELISRTARKQYGITKINP
jgi:hypothetical protein